LAPIADIAESDSQAIIGIIERATVHRINGSDPALDLIV
jgi:hypothetical protein